MSNHTKPQLAENPTFRKMNEHLAELKRLRTAFCLTRPLLRLAGVDVAKASMAFATLPELERTAAKLIQIPDRFNDTFGGCGWIAYDTLSSDAMNAALDAADSESVEAGEQVLVDHFTDEIVDWGVRGMRAVEAYSPRMDLTQKAFEDFKAERYHACVPVVLAQVDGLVSDLHDSNQGFFARDTTLSAWDSIAAHEKGLGQLVKLFQKARRTTRTESISVPYRHGIVHGHDLGYDNRIVAVKCWAALFAVRDWAQRVERGPVEKPPDEPKATFLEAIEQYQQIQTQKEALEMWKPRQNVLDKDAPISGFPPDIQPNTPEWVVVEYLTLWKKKNYGLMIGYIDDRFAPMRRGAIGQVREAFSELSLERFEVLEIDDQAAALTEVKVRLFCLQYGKPKEIEHAFRALLAHDLAVFDFSRVLSGQEWKIVNWRIF